MFKLNLSGTFQYPVELQIVDEKGKPQLHKLRLTFKRFSREQLIGLGEFGKDDTRTGDAVIEADLDYLLQFVDGWADVTDEDGQPLDFSRDNLRALLNAVPNIHHVIRDTFYEAINGGSRRKN
ncbi:phage tail assembly chaperone [Methylomonas sp. MED-D]|uniref:phage tail assembly chaperone n=1 Tax=unclassified Methylomonas TaxID=2608980 RepID=UPI003CFD9B87